MCFLLALPFLFFCLAACFLCVACLWGPPPVLCKVWAYAARFYAGVTPDSFPEGALSRHVWLSCCCWSLVPVAVCVCVCVYVCVRVCACLAVFLCASGSTLVRHRLPMLTQGRAQQHEMHNPPHCLPSLLLIHASRWFPSCAFSLPLLVCPRVSFATSCSRWGVMEYYITGAGTSPCLGSGSISVIGLT